jgi:hypothetical protein
MGRRTATVTAGQRIDQVVPDLVADAVDPRAARRLELGDIDLAQRLRDRSTAAGDRVVAIERLEAAAKQRGDCHHRRQSRNRAHFRPQH